MAKEKKIGNLLTSCFLAECLIFFGSFISFPVFTRILSKSDYGVMNIITTSLMLAVTLGSMGLNNSSLRFFSAYGEDTGRDEFLSSLNYGTVFFSFVLFIIYIFISHIVVQFGYVKGYPFYLFIASGLIILIRPLTKLYLSIIRSQERIHSYNIFNIFIRYSGIALSVFMVIFYGSLTSFYAGIFVAESVILIIICIFLSKSERIFSSFNKEIFTKAFKYGYPLCISGLVSFILFGSDKYILGYLLGSSSVADYSVSFNFCNYSIEILRNVFLATFIPIIMNSWNDNSDPDNLFLTDFVEKYCFLVVPMVIGLCLVDREGISILAGQNYQAINGLVPLLALGLGVSGLHFAAVSGLHYKGNSKLILYLTLFCSCLNIFLNFLMIPFWGILGAGVATLVTQIAFFTIGFYFGRKTLGFKIPLKGICTAGILGGFIFVAVQLVPYNENHYVFLIEKIFVGVIVYGLGWILFKKKTLFDLVK